jgi:hypothetical protein
VHELHCPPLQTMSVPHETPLPILAGLMQVEEPVVHDVVPVRQALPPGVQLIPAVQATQFPPLQTWLVPQAVPSCALDGLVHVDKRPAHDVVPIWQTLPPGLQVAPSVHAPQVPLLHDWPEPHGVPSCATPFCVQTLAPELQST